MVSTAKIFQKPWFRAVDLDGELEVTIDYVDRVQLRQGSSLGDLLQG